MFNRFLSSLIFLSLAACTSVTPTPLPTSQPTSTFTPQPTSTLRPTATNTSIPSSTITTPLSLGDLNAKGTIWVNLEKNYLLVDLDRKTLLKTKSSGCNGLLPFTTISVCDFVAKPFMIDLLNDKTEDLPRLGTGRFDSTSNGRFLFYEINDKQKDRTVFASYDLLTQTYQNLTAEVPNSDRENWLEFPSLSSDGQHLVITKYISPWNYQIFEFIKGTVRYKQISSVYLSVGVYKAWSPVSSQLLFGATDLKSEIGFGYADTNSLYLADFNTGEVQLLARAPKNEFYRMTGNFNNVWSPDGKQVAVFTSSLISSSNKLCIIALSTKEQKCYEPIAERWGGCAWSADGQYLAAIEQSMNGYSDLIVITPSDGKRIKVIKVLEDYTGDAVIYWR